MHVKVEIGGKLIHALVDTGATDNFLQEDTVKALGLVSRMEPSNRHVVMANGEREKVTGYCFRGKGQAAIIGFKFLEENGYLVDCRFKRLTKVGEPDVQCFEAHGAEQKNELGLVGNPAFSQA